MAMVVLEKVREREREREVNLKMSHYPSTFKEEIIVEKKN